MTRPRKTDLALYGGPPVRPRPFPSWPRPTRTMRESLIRTLEHEQWGVGSEVVKRFERAFARFHDSRFAISTNSGTAALWVALKAAGVRPGDEVIVPAYTFVATASAVLMVNAVPVFVDIDRDTLNLDPSLLEDAVTERTRVIMPVHLAGSPAHMDRIGAVARRHGISVIEDAAQAHGAEWKGRKVGAIGLGGVFSFQSSKNMTAGEGGAVVSDDEDFIGKCYAYHNVGRIKRGELHPEEISEGQRFLGGNFRLSAFPAALLEAQIEALPDDMKIRDGNAAVLDEEIGKIAGLYPQKHYPEASRVSHHLYIFRYDRSQFNDTSREEFIRALNAEGIPAYAGYKPVYQEPLFVVDQDEYPWLKGKDFSRLSLPVTERISHEEAVWLRQNCLLGTKEDTGDIVEAIRKVAGYYGRDS
ncbi:MAG: DegT/DnrJ/EryC1/StrS family aminotransferase [Fidelibacterota bacterium]